MIGEKGRLEAAESSRVRMMRVFAPLTSDWRRMLVSTGRSVGGGSVGGIIVAGEMEGEVASWAGSTLRFLVFFSSGE